MSHFTCIMSILFLAGQVYALTDISFGIYASDLQNVTHTERHVRAINAQSTKATELTFVLATVEKVLNRR